jgi:hypothetical protein
MQEWTAQAELEQHFCLEQSVQPSADPLGKAKSQIFFISAFAKPLLDLSVQAIPGSFVPSYSPFLWVVPDQTPFHRNG